MAEVLFLVPASISTALLSSWIDVRALVRLSHVVDQSPEKKQHLTDLLCSKSFVFHDTVDASNTKLITWVNDQNLKVSSIVFSQACADESIVSKYFRRFGNSARVIDIQDSQTDQTLFRIAAYCKNLTKLSCSNMELNSAFTDILSCNPNIQKISLEEVTCIAAEVFDGLHLHKLTSFSVTDCEDADDFHSFPWSVSAFSDSLLRVDLAGSSIFASEVYALLRNCPQIKALGLSRIDWTDEEIKEIVELRPTISEIDVSTNNSITDTGIGHIVANLQSLRFINCQHCPHVTSNSLRILAEGCGGSLEIAYIDLHTPHDPETIQALEEFSSQMPVLQILGVRGDGTELCSGGATYAIAHGCKELRKLVLSKTTVSVSSCKFIGDFHPQLEISEQESVSFDMSMMPFYL